MTKEIRQSDKIIKIREKYFGGERDTRYILKVYRDCLEKLILSAIVTELFTINATRHTHPKNTLCRKCDILLQVSDSCYDSLYLHLRLLFSMNHKKLAHTFLEDVASLKEKDFRDYFARVHGCTLSSESINEMTTVATEATKTLAKIKKLYTKHISRYQTEVFHQSKSGRHYNVEHKVEDSDGFPINIYVRSSKFTRNPKAASDMLGLLSSCVHDYMRLTGTYYHMNTIKPEDSIKDISDLFNIEYDQSEVDKMIKLISDDLNDHIHLLECGDGLRIHNQLQFMMMKASQGKS